MPQALIEALTRGKYVIWSNEFPHCLRARSLPDARKALEIALARDHPNGAGMEYARQEFEPLRIAHDLKYKYLELLSKSQYPHLA